MTRTLSEARHWMQHGTDLFRASAEALTERQWKDPSVLPGWTQRMLVAHVAANADALRNLVHWASTGEETPMYSSADERMEGIARGEQLDSFELLAWFDASAERLETDMSSLTDAQWSQPVITAQGRDVTAAEIPWMRAREVMVHAADLDSTIAFRDLPESFLLALRNDIVSKRGEVPDVRGPLAEVIAWLAGRRHDGVVAPDGTEPPDLPPWL